jgi:hypothetical protein
MQTTRALGAAALLATLALTGCAGAAEEATATSAAPAAAEVRTPAPNDQMKDESAKGLSATTYYYFDAMNYALQTGKTDLMLSVAADCAECADAAEEIAAVYADGGRVEGGQPKAQNVIPLGEVDAKGALSAVVPFREDAKTVFDAAGGVVEETSLDPAGTIYTVGGEYVDGAWAITSLKATPDAEIPE